MPHDYSALAAIDSDDATANNAGAELARLLGLRRDPEHADRWKTTGELGTKTSAGLARSVLRVLLTNAPPAVAPSAYPGEAEWPGSPDPSDPDNFWIDDNTGERVNAATGERSPAKNGGTQ